jgi:SAM-dependent methyltransferase
MGQLTSRIKKIIDSRILKRWGNTAKRKSIWDEEFSSGKWDYLDNTCDDPIYTFLERYCNGGVILDLGCGSGNTGNEMDASKYSGYTGVDISESAVRKAVARSQSNGRGEKNEYIFGDICEFTPGRRYDIILFRESIFYIPKSRIRSVLDRYRDYLKGTGVFIVRMCDRKKYASIVRLIDRHYHVVDSSRADAANVILVFR